MNFKIFCFSTFLLAGSVPTMAENTETNQVTEGYSYTLHTANPDVEVLGQFPPAYDNPTTEHVLQGPEYTLIWRDRISERTVDKASFALGERHMGLFIPRWEKGKPVSESTGWTEFGYPLVYLDFNVQVERGEGARALAGGQAEHYVLTADFNSKRETDPGSSRYKIHSDLWILKDKPFSFAPFHTPGLYGDPRFGAAIEAELSKLGMVVRSDARYSRVTIDRDGNETNSRSKGTWTTWITDLKPAEVPVIDMPVGDEATLQVLQDEFRNKPDEACQTVINGTTPDFIAENLNSAQQSAVLEDLGRSCKRQAMKGYFRTLKKNPASVCGDILAGKLPDIAKKTFNQKEQKEFMQLASSFCKKQN